VAFEARRPRSVVIISVRMGGSDPGMVRFSDGGAGF